MKENIMALSEPYVIQMLRQTSRTFSIPISLLPKGLQEAIASGYLCLRAIDEIEDHPDLEKHQKANLLRSISLIFQAQTSVDTFAHDALGGLFNACPTELPEVTRRIGEWACHAPAKIAPRVWEATAAMADRMARWVEDGFQIITKMDLDRYTYSVAGAVGLLICDLWGWFDNLQLDRSEAIRFGRGLQLVNILRNRKEDLSRGVDFYPHGWTDMDVFSYAEFNLDSVNISRDEFGKGKSNFVNFIEIPRALAYGTLNALRNGKEKLSRNEVLEIIQKLGITI